MKKIVFILTLFSCLIFAGSLNWQRKGGINYIIIADLAKNKTYDIPYKANIKGKTLAIVVMSKGTGNLDVDAALYDQEKRQVVADTDTGAIAVVTHTFENEGEAYLKISCTSGRGRAIVYAEEASKLLKILTTFYMN